MKAISQKSTMRDHQLQPEIKHVTFAQHRLVHPSPDIEDNFFRSNWKAKLWVQPEEAERTQQDILDTRAKSRNGLVVLDTDEHCTRGLESMWDARGKVRQIVSVQETLVEQKRLAHRRVFCPLKRGQQIAEVYASFAAEASEEAQHRALHDAYDVFQFISKELSQEVPLRAAELKRSSSCSRSVAAEDHHWDSSSSRTPQSPKAR